MTGWLVAFLGAQIVTWVGLLVLWVRGSRRPQDDPRLSAGLQLLQNKIAILEDLSDRSEVQVKQLNALMDQKILDVQKRIEEGERLIGRIEGAMQKSLEVAEIFQDRIPHDEILERQNTIRYVTAARLAHQGKTVEEISREVDLPVGELEFIAKVNRDELMFHEDALPAWAQKGGQRKPTPTSST